MNKKIYSLIIFLVLTFFFIYFNFFYFEPKVFQLDNSSKCRVVYNVKYYDIKCRNFDDFYVFYLKNSKVLLYKKIKFTNIDNALKFEILR